MSETIGNTASSGSPRRAVAPPRLIVNADDFGICPRVNEGIVLAHRTGILTAASLMAGGEAFTHAVSLCRRSPSLDIGVHLTLVGARPLLPDVPSLLDGAGRFPSGIGPFLVRYLKGRVSLSDVRREWAAQIERVLDNGIRPTHLDSHQHLHTIPGLSEIATELADRYHIPFIRRPFEPMRLERPLCAHGVSRIAGSCLLRVFRLSARHRVRRTDGGKRIHFMGFFDGGRLDANRLAALLERLQPGRTYELMCHPGKAPRSPAIRAWGYRHEEELEALTSPLLRSRVAARGIELCNFKECIDFL